MISRYVGLHLPFPLNEKIQAWYTYLPCYLLTGGHWSVGPGGRLRAHGRRVVVGGRAHAAAVHAACKHQYNYTYNNERTFRSQKFSTRLRLNLSWRRRRKEIRIWSLSKNRVRIWHDGITVLICSLSKLNFKYLEDKTFWLNKRKSSLLEKIVWQYNTVTKAMAKSIYFTDLAVHRRWGSRRAGWCTGSPSRTGSGNRYATPPEYQALVLHKVI